MLPVPNRLLLRLWRDAPSKRYQSHVTCAACGTINRRELVPRDHECWSCGVKLPLVVVLPGTASFEASAASSEHGLAS